MEKLQKYIPAAVFLMSVYSTYIIHKGYKEARLERQINENERLITKF